MKKRGIALILSSAVAVSTCAALCSCSDPDPKPKRPELYGDIAVIDGVELDYENAFFDGFDGGIDYDSWYIGKQAWGSSGDGNGGVVPQNVNYTDDGILVLTGNGSYYTDGDVRGVGAHKDGTLTGGALISKFKVRPGRYEIKMKVLPRLGACSAFWTFAYDNATKGNHEIDIELPGGTHSGGVLGFDRILNTNYWTESQSVSKDTLLGEATGGALTSAVDGEWHTFGFDWYTSTPGQDEYVKVTTDKNGVILGEDGTRYVDDDGYIVEDGVRTEKKVDAKGYVYTIDKDNNKVLERNTAAGTVVYYVDGKITAVNEELVPWYESRLWVGVWFPNNTGFVGDADFETDYMLVDYVKYIPFKNQTYTEFDPAVNGYAERSEYPTKPVSLANVNKIANGSFEYRESDKQNSGWAYRNGVYSSADYALAQADFEKLYFDEHPTAIDDRIKSELAEKRVRDSFDAAHGDEGLTAAQLDKAYAEYKATAEYEAATVSALSEVEADYAAFIASDEYETYRAAAVAAIKRTTEYRRGEIGFIYPDVPSCTVDTDIGAHDTCGAKIENSGMLVQTIDSIYGGTAFDVKADVKGKGTVKVAFLQAEGGMAISEAVIGSVDGEDFASVSGSVTAPEGTRFIEVRFTTVYGGAMYIDNVEVRL